MPFYNFEVDYAYWMIDVQRMSGECLNPILYLLQLVSDCLDRWLTQYDDHTQQSSWSESRGVSYDPLENSTIDLFQKGQIAKPGDT